MLDKNTTGFLGTHEKTRIQGTHHLEIGGIQTFRSWRKFCCNLFQEGIAVYPALSFKGREGLGSEGQKSLALFSSQQDGSNISTTFADFPCLKRGFPMFDYRWVLGFSVPIASWGGELFRLLIEKVAVNWKTRFIWQRNIAYLKGYHIKIAFFQNKCCIF